VEPWRSESHPGKQLLLAVGLLAVGVVLAGAARNGPAGNVGVKAAFLLGLLLLALGIVGLVMAGKQTVVVDPGPRTITVEDSGLFSKRRTIAFDEVREVAVGYQGRRSNRVQTYYLRLTLGNGRKYSLFAPGRFYEGASDRSVVEGWQARLERYIAG
jgi:hypothetical protein